MTRAAGKAARAVTLTVSLTLLAALSTACGAAPAKVGPTGVDGLTIPTPSPDPADFSGHTDNPWFPLAPGTRWTYRLDAVTSSSTVSAEVLAQTRDIAGVTTTGVRWRVRERGTERTAFTRWYAVDTAGNVWWFGQRVGPVGPTVDHLARHSFTAGRGGAEAGLLVPGAPRVGDGFLNVRRPRLVERHSTVLSVTGTVATSAQTFRHTLVTRDQSTLEPVHTVQTFFARGIGLVAQQDTTSASTTLTFVRVRRP
jgi:hypothetical protein